MMFTFPNFFCAPPTADSSSVKYSCPPSHFASLYLFSFISTGLMYWWLIYLVWSSVIQIRLQRWARRWHAPHLAAPSSPSATSGSQHWMLKWQTSVDPCFMKSFPPFWNPGKYGILGVLLCADIIKTLCEQEELYGSQPKMLPVSVPHSLCTDRSSQKGNLAGTE